MNRYTSGVIHIEFCSIKRYINTETKSILTKDQYAVAIPDLMTCTTCGHFIRGDLFSSVTFGKGTYRVLLYHKKCVKSIEQLHNSINKSEN